MSRNSSSQLPERPNLDHLRGQAKRLLAAVRRGDPAATRRVRPYMDDGASPTLSRMQLAVARDYGFSSWRALKEFVDAVSSSGGALIAAVRAGDADSVAAILDAHPSLVRAAVDRDSCTLPTETDAMPLLHICVAENHPELVRLLIARGADVDAVNADGRTALHDSLELSRDRVTSALLACGAYVDICAAAIMGDTARMRALIDEDPRRVSDLNTGLSPLGWASYGGHPETVRVLAHHGATLTAMDALAPAASCGHAAFIEAALELGADPNERFEDGQLTALHFAARMDYTIDSSAAAAALIAGGADPNLPDASGESARQLARRLAASSVGGKRYDRLLEALGRSS